MYLGTQGVRTDLKLVSKLYRLDSLNMEQVFMQQSVDIVVLLCQLFFHWFSILSIRLVF